MTAITITQLGPDSDPGFEICKQDPRNSDRDDDMVHVTELTRPEALELYHALANALMATSPVQVDPVTPEMANQVLHFFGRGGYAPGAFVGSLFHTMVRADRINFARMALSFPGYHAAMDMAKNGTDGGIDRLAEIAQGSDHSHVGARECSCGWVKPAEGCTCEECVAGHA